MGDIEFSDDEHSKDIVDADGRAVGRVVDVDRSSNVLYVKPDSNVSPDVANALDWTLPPSYTAGTEDVDDDLEPMYDERRYSDDEPSGSPTVTFDEDEDEPGGPYVIQSDIVESIDDETIQLSIP